MPSFSIQSSASCFANHCQATRALWLCLYIVSEGLMSDILDFVRPDRKKIRWSGHFWRWSSLKLKYWNAGRDVCGGCLCEHWTSRSWQGMNLLHWSAHWGTSNRTCIVWQTSSHHIFFDVARKNRWTWKDVLNRLQSMTWHHNAVNVTYSPNSLEVHIKLRCCVPVGTPFNCVATPSPWWRSISQASVFWEFSKDTIDAEQVRAQNPFLCVTWCRFVKNLRSSKEGWMPAANLLSLISESKSSQSLSSSGRFLNDTK